MWSLPQLSEGLVPSRTVQAEKNLDSKAVIIHWYSSSTIWFKASSVNMSSEEQTSKYIQSCGQAGQYETSQNNATEKSLWVTAKTSPLSTLPPLCTDVPLRPKQ